MNIEQIRIVGEIDKRILEIETSGRAHPTPVHVSWLLRITVQAAGGRRIESQHVVQVPDESSLFEYALKKMTRDLRFHMESMTNEILATQDEGRLDGGQTKDSGD